MPRPRTVKKAKVQPRSKIPKNYRSFGTKLRNLWSKRIVKVLLLIVILFAGYKAYYAYHYIEAPQEVKLLREQEIYNYRTDDIKRVRVSEDYGGLDWKNVYNDPAVYLRFKSKSGKSYEEMSKVLSNVLVEQGWLGQSDYAIEDKKRYVFNKDIHGHIFQLVMSLEEYSGYLTLRITDG